MKRTFLLCLACLFLSAVSAQSTKKIRELETKRSELHQQIAESETLLQSAKKDVKSQLDNLALLTGQIAERKKYVDAIETDVNSLSQEITLLQKQLSGLQRDLTDKKKKYEASVQYMYRNKSVQEKLMFIFSAENLSQTYRRMRYVHEYANFQRLQGMEIQRKQRQVAIKKQELEQTKGAKEGLLKQGEAEKAKLEVQEKDRQTLLANLQKKQKGIQNELSKNKRTAQQLNAQIDRLIEIEIEKARKRAEEEARKKAAAEAAAKAKAEAEAKARAEAEARAKAAVEANARAKAAAEAAARAKAKAAAEMEAKARAKAQKEAEAAEKLAKREAEAAAKAAAKSADAANEVAEVRVRTAPVEVFNMNTEDRRLSDNFERNRGVLPMPITGAYVVVSHYGQYEVGGLRNVKLDNKGIDIKGKEGAQARAIFNGEVSAIFQYNGLNNVLVRHGNYISVYCNLSTVSVSKGSKVNTRDIIGTIHTDSSGNTVLHFQLRKETAKLNPESWLGR